MSGRADRRARHALIYPPEERGRRILWRTVTFAGFTALTAPVVWFTYIRGWIDEPFIRKGLLALVALPYWAVVMAVWKRRGPYLPKLHGNERPATTTPEERSSDDAQSDPGDQTGALVEDAGTAR
ncbi:hypothetical protein KRM28CT15_00110 [Krasilnikovia sp. M28-CT-15]